MHTGMVKRFANALRHGVGRFKAEERGVAAVEFAMVVPIMFFLFVGTIEFSQALTVDRRVTQAASSAADLVARAPASGIDTTSLERSLDLVKSLMMPYDQNALTITVYSVRAVPSPANPANVTYEVDWSRDSAGATPISGGTAYNDPDLAPNLLVAGESVVIAHAKYAYNPLIFHYFIDTVFDLSEKFFLKPRNSTCVHLRPRNCLTGVDPDPALAS